MSNATVTGPISGGDKGWPFAASMSDVKALGYIEEEYFLEGTATSFATAPGTTFGPDGLWQVVPKDEAPFKTRFIVYRPADPAKFNGTVIVTWNNVTAGYDLFGADSLEIFEGGFALVCLTTQRAGIVGLEPIEQGLWKWDPARYGTLSIPSDDYSYDIFTQAGRAVGVDRDRACDPLGGLDVKHVVAQGASQSAGRLGTYVNAIAPHSNAYDGFILTIYFGRGSPIEVGDTLVNINAPQGNAAPRARLQGENLLRDDPNVPVFVVNSELEAIACYAVRQPDTPSFRYWESAGTCHVSQQSRTIRQKMSDRDGIIGRPAETGINAIPMNPLYDAAYHHMHRWLSESLAPPVQPKVDFEGDPAEVVRDEHGIACGGIRLPQAEVPLAVNSAIPLSDDIFAVLGGSSKPFPADKIKSLYGTSETFLGRFTVAAEAAVNAGVLRPAEVENLVAEAASLWPAAEH